MPVAPTNDSSNKGQWPVLDDLAAGYPVGAALGFAVRYFSNGQLSGDVASLSQSMHYWHRAWGWCMPFCTSKNMCRFHPRQALFLICRPPYKYSPLIARKIAA
eukprot:scaffold200789_cov18-Tisochrysis_lutea.AAC.1